MKSNRIVLRSPDTIGQPVSVESWSDTMNAFRDSYIHLTKHLLDQAQNLTKTARADQAKQLLVIMHTELALLGSQPTNSFGNAGLTAYTVHLRFLTDQASSIVNSKPIRSDNGLYYLNKRS